MRQQVIATLGRFEELQASGQLERLVHSGVDTTSLYFEGAGGQTLGRHGYSKDHRPCLNTAPHGLVTHQQNLLEMSCGFPSTIVMANPSADEIIATTASALIIPRSATTHTGAMLNAVDQHCEDHLPQVREGAVRDSVL